jgi:DNA polymerase III delta prime subunit
MVSWLVKHAPKRFDALALPPEIISQITAAACKSNPPHLLIAGPSGVGKTALWRLIARQVLGVGWASTTHVLQARDLAGSSGAMGKFEAFLKPSGGSSRDTLASRTSLEAFDRKMFSGHSDDVAPAGEETEILLEGRAMTPISRLIVIEDADHLGPKRQPFLRRMMEQEAHTSRFIFTARSPSRLIDALRSRTQFIRLPATSAEMISGRLEQISTTESLSPAAGLLGDLAHVASGNLRRAIFLLEILALKDLLDNRSRLQELVAATTFSNTQRAFEAALRGRIHEWKWQKVSGRNRRVLHGAMGQFDRLRSEHSLQPEDIIEQLHALLVSGKLLLPTGAIGALLSALASCDVRLQRSIHPRIQFERLFNDVSIIGREFGLAV